jgi:hypothetical protein
MYSELQAAGEGARHRFQIRTEKKAGATFEVPPGTDIDFVERQNWEDAAVATGRVGSLTKPSLPAIDALTRRGTVASMANPEISDASQDFPDAKTVVSSQSVKFLDILQKAVRRLSVHDPVFRMGTVEFNGAITSTTKRYQIINDFNKPNKETTVSLGRGIPSTARLRVRERGRGPWVLLAATVLLAAGVVTAICWTLCSFGTSSPTHTGT